MADQLTERQIAELKEVFNQFDKDQDGFLLQKELGDMLERLGQPATKEQLEEFTKEIKGKIDFTDFMSLMAAKMKDTDTDEDLTEVFRMFDRNSNDVINPEEFRYIVTQCGQDITLEEAKEMFEHAKTKIGMEVSGRRDGLGYDDFIRMMMDTNN